MVRLGGRFYRPTLVDEVVEAEECPPGVAVVTTTEGSVCQTAIKLSDGRWLLDNRTVAQVVGAVDAALSTRL